jgi:hypothetical protein
VAYRLLCRTLPWFVIGSGTNLAGQVTSWSPGGSSSHRFLIHVGRTIAGAEAAEKTLVKCVSPGPLLWGSCCVEIEGYGRDPIGRHQPSLAEGYIVRFIRNGFPHGSDKFAPILPIAGRADDAACNGAMEQCQTRIEGGSVGDVNSTRPAVGKVE